MSRPNGYWIGHPGALLPLPDVGGVLNRKTERAASFSTSASGARRAYLSARRAPLREWSVNLPRLRPNEAAPLHDLLMYTDPPYVWVDPWSIVTNLLTPAAAGLSSTRPGPLPRLGRQPLFGGGFAAVAVANNNTGFWIQVEPAPVVAGMPVTVSAYIASPSGGQVGAKFLDSNGVAVGSISYSSVVTGTDVLRRVSATATPPVGAVAVELVVYNATVIAQPAVTWTSELLEYGPGGGAAQVIVTGLDEPVQWATREAKNQRWADMSFTVTELG